MALAYYGCRSYYGCRCTRRWAGAAILTMAVPEQVHEALGEGGFSIVYRGVYGKQQDGTALQVAAG